MMYTEWKGYPAASLDEYIQIVGEIDPAACKTDCLKDVSICSRDVDGKEKLTVFFKCPSWKTETQAYYCQQQLEGRFFNHIKLCVNLYHFHFSW